MRATRPLTTLALSALVAGVAACGTGDDDRGASADAPAIADVREWCTTIRSVDRQMELAASTATVGFEDQQAALTRANRLLVDLRERADLVPPAERASVDGTLAWATELTGAMADAPTWTDAEAAAGPLYEQVVVEDAEAALTWIKLECGVGLDD